MYPIDFVIAIVHKIDVLFQTTVFWFSPFLPVTLEDIFVGSSAIAGIFAVVGKLYE